MSKLYNKPVEVRIAGETPEAFLWRGKWRKVERAAHGYCSAGLTVFIPKQT